MAIYMTFTHAFGKKMFLTLFFATIVLLLLYIKRKYFTLRGPIPGSSPHLLFGNLIETGVLFNGASIAEGFAQFKKRFGSIFQFWMGPARVIVVGNVNDVQHIYTNRNIYDQSDVALQQIGVIFPGGLMSIKGAAFRRHSAVTAPLFRRGKIVANFDLIINCTDKLLNNWRRQSFEKIHTGIIRQCQNLLLGIFGFIAFDYDLETLSDDSSENNNELTQELEYKMNVFEVVLYAPSFLSKIYLYLSRRYRQSQAIINRYMNQMTEKELNESPESRAERKRTSFIASLVASLQQDEKAEAMKNERDKKGLSRDEVFNEILLFLVASYDTTSSSLLWFIHLMSKHPEVQKKIKAEIMKDNESQQLTLDRLDSFVYLDCVLKEVFRFCPIIAGTGRTLTVDDRLPESGFQLHKGDSVLIPFHNLARDSRYWSIDPELFYPERFLNEDKNHHPYAFLPFGAGHRACIGQDLAQFELKVIAARLMQYVTFGDGGPELNSGGYTGAVIKPKHIGVTISFDL